MWMQPSGGRDIGVDSLNVSVMPVWILVLAQSCVPIRAR